MTGRCELRRRGKGGICGREVSVGSSGGGSTSSTFFPLTMTPASQRSPARPLRSSASAVAVMHLYGVNRYGPAGTSPPNRRALGDSWSKSARIIRTAGAKPLRSRRECPRRRMNESDPSPPTDPATGRSSGSGRSRLTMGASAIPVRGLKRALEPNRKPGIYPAGGTL